MKTNETRQDRSPKGEAAREGRKLDAGSRVEMDASEGWLRVSDPRLFRRTQRTFCTRLLEAAVGRPEVRRVKVDLASASCELAFAPGEHSRELMADVFITAIRQASDGALRKDQGGWWEDRKGWSVLTAYSATDGASVWETLEEKPGRLSLRHQGTESDASNVSRLARELGRLEGVLWCSEDLRSQRITLNFLPESSFAAQPLDRVEQTFERLISPQGQPQGALSLAPRINRTIVQVATGPKRLFYLGMAGGSFALALVALVVPGAPTVPCLLATSYYLARSSPRLDDKLKHTAFFGPILQEWEEHGGLSRLSKGKLIELSLAIVVITISLSPMTPVVLVVMLLLLSISVYGIVKIPALSEADQRTLSPQGPGNFLPQTS